MKKLEVRFQTSPEEFRVVGTLAESVRGVFFEYDASFLNNPLWLSPFKLKPQPGLIQHKDRGFGPLFGLFDDSLPDGWGLLLMDRYLTQQGILPSTISPLDRLAFLGERTMGALTYFPPQGEQESDKTIVDLHKLSKFSSNVVQCSQS